MTSNAWILVSDRTPEPGQTVLAWWDLRHGPSTECEYMVVTYLNPDSWQGPDDDYSYSPPDAWMPIPPPPEMT